MLQVPFDFFENGGPEAESPVEKINPHEYDDVIVAFSSGKDSVACVLHLIEQGIKPELWHHDVDGKGENFFDWPVTKAYAQAFADHLGLKIYHSWREGGLEAEMTKTNDRTKPVYYETPDGLKSSGGIRGKIATRRKWPAVSADLRVRWCSAVAKIDVFSAAMAGQDRFKGRKVLVVTSERRQESTARSKYLEAEPHRTNAPGKIARRHVMHWRPVIDWSEEQVWEIIRKHGIVPHPCYRLGFSRASCMICIFSSANQVAAIKTLDPERFAKVIGYEKDFNHTIRSDIGWDELAAKAEASNYDPEIVKLAMSRTYEAPIFTENWEIPKGAFGEACGPT